MSRLVPETPEFQSNSLSAGHTRRKRQNSIFSSIIFLSSDSANTLSVGAGITAALEQEVWRVHVPQLSGRGLWRGWTARVLPGGSAAQPQVLPPTQGRVSGRGHLHRAVPGRAGQPPLGSAHHPQLPAGRLVPLYDAPGSGRGAHVQPDHPPGSEPVPLSVPSGTEVLLLHRPQR